MSKEQKSLIVENLSLKYDDNVVLNDINFEIGDSEILALVGPSGSGKSTLIKNLVGLYEPSSGQILYDGHEWLEYCDHVIRDSFAYVPQESSSFRGTIFDNITMYNDQYTLDQVRTIASMACFDDVVMDMPKGYSTVLGEKGAGLSGGQLQRLAITRALLKQPEMIFLDEATSALDIPTEKKVIMNIKGLGKTVISVAHRLLTAKLSNKVVVLEDGLIKEIGDPIELMNKSDSLFTSLVVGNV